MPSAFKINSFNRFFHLLIVFIVASNLAYTQIDWRAQMTEKSVDLNQIQLAFEMEYGNRDFRTLSPSEQFEVIRFEKWKYQWQDRVDTNGGFNYGQEILRSTNNIQNTTRRYTIGNGNWQLVGPVVLPQNGTGQLNGLGRTTSIAFHPVDVNTIYVGSPSGGVWKSIDSGQNWTQMVTGLTGLGVSSIVIHPSNPDIIYIGTGDRDGGDSPGYGVWKSIDGGSNWNPSNTGMGNRTINEVLMDPTNPNILLAASSNRIIYRSTDAGASWSASSDLGNNPKDLEFHPTNSNIVYASGTEFHRSTDGGITWNRITGVLPASPQRMAVATSVDQPNWVYVLAGDGAGLIGVYRSTNSGNTFTLRTNSPNILGYQISGADTNSQAFFDLVINVDPTDANIIYTGGINIWKSTDGGANMNATSYWVGPSAGLDGVHNDQHVLEFSPHNNDLYSGNGGGIYYSSDSGSLWNDISSGLAIAQVYKIGVSQLTEGRTIIGTQGNGTILGAGEQFQTEIGGSGMECAYDPTDDTYVYGSLFYGDIRRSTNGGNIFGTISIATGENGAFITPYKLDPNNSNTMFAGYNDVWRNDAVRTGNTWTQISNFTNTLNIRDLAIAPSNSNVVYVSKYDNSLRKSTNALSPSPTWTDLSTNLPANNEPLDIEIDPNDENHLFIALDRNIYESTNGGNSWTDISGSLPNINLNTIVIDNTSAVQALYVGMDIGVFYKDNTMSDWTAYDTGLTPVQITELEIQYLPNECKSVLYAGTYGNSLWKSDLKDPGSIAPQVCFESSFQNVCLGTGVQFTDNSDFTPTSWSWTFTPNTVVFENSTSASSQNPEVTFTAVGNYSVTLTSTNSNGANSETKTDYILVNNSDVATLFNEDFETQALCGTASDCGITTCNITGNWNNLINGTDDDIDWRVDEGGTPSTGTGPATDFNPGTATGNYIYLEASSCNSSTGILETDCINVDQAYNFTYAYHMFGNNMGELHLDLFSAGNWTNDILPAVIGDQGNVWLNSTLDLSPYVGETIRLRFRGTIGTGFGSDMALDDLQFTASSAANSLTAVCQDINVQLDSGNSYTLDASEINNNSATSASCLPVEVKIATNESITSAPANPLSRWSGVMFDVVAANDIVITDVIPNSTSFAPISFSAEFFFKRGSFVGSETVSTDWEAVSPPFEIFVRAGETVAFYPYIDYIQQVLDLSIPVSNQEIIDSNADLSIIGGIALGNSFNPVTSAGSPEFAGYNGSIDYKILQDSIDLDCSNVGTETVDMAVVDNCDDIDFCTSSVTITPYIDFSIMTNQVVNGSYTLPTITGTNLSGNQMYYSQPDGNGTAFAEADVIQESDFASYPVTLYIYDSTDGCSDEESFQLTINAAVTNPLAAVFPETVTVCTGVTFALTGKTDGTGRIIEWLDPSSSSLGSGTVNGNSSTISITVPTTNGSYAYSYTVTDPVSGLSTTKISTIIVEDNTRLPGCDNIYVTPTALATGAGTQMDPTSLQQALTMATCNNTIIKMGIGTYNIDAPLSIRSNITLEGGFDPNGMEIVRIGTGTGESAPWIKYSTIGATTINRTLNNPEGQSGVEQRLTPVQIYGSSQFRLQDVSVTTSDAIDLGISTYGVVLNTASDYNITRTAIEIGNASNGTNGTNGGDSYGILISNNGANGTIEHSYVRAGNAGTGGTGSSGTNGQPGIVDNIFWDGTGTAPAAQDENYELFNQQIIYMTNVNCTNTDIIAGDPSMMPSHPNNTASPQLMPIGLPSTTVTNWDFDKVGTRTFAHSNTSINTNTNVSGVQYTATGRYDIIHNTCSGCGAAGGPLGDALEEYRGFHNISQENTAPAITSNAPSTATDEYTVCAGDTATFEMNSPATTYTWDFNGAITNPGNVSSTTNQFNTGGIFTITGRITTDCCGDSLITTVILNVLETNVDDLVDQTATGSYTLPAITGTGLSGNQMYYTQPDGMGTAFAEADVIQESDFTSYPVTLYIYDSTAGCSDEESFSLTINPSAQVAITEFLVNATVNETTDEWIELYNYGSTTVDLIDWRLKDEDLENNLIINTTYALAAGEYVILAKSKVDFERDWLNGCTSDRVIEVAMLLGNDSDEIIIEDNLGNTIYSVAYQNDESTGRATFFTEFPTFNTTVYGSKASPGLNRAGNDVTGTLGYEKNDVATDPDLRTALNGDQGSPLANTNSFVVADDPANVTECDSYTLPVLTNSTYWTMSGGNGLQLMAGDVINSTQTIFAFAETGTVPNCTNENSFVVTIIDTQDASFSYADSVYFSDSANPTPTITGVTGGVFTVTPSTGLTINSSTGQIDIASSTAGDYTITYSTSGVCPDSQDFMLTLEPCQTSFTPMKEILAIQDFETVSATPTWGFTGAINYNSGDSGAGASPPNSPLGIGSSRAWETTSNSAGAIAEFDNIIIPAGYDSVEFEFRLAAMNLIGSTGGPDRLDYVEVEYSLDNGLTYVKRLTIRGASTNDSVWAYDATGEAIVDHLPATEETFQPADSGVRTTDGFSTNGIRFPGTISQLKIRIKARSSSSTDSWLIDNVVVKGITSPSGIEPDNAMLPDVTTQCEVMSLIAPTATDPCTGANFNATTSTMLPITTQGTTIVTWTYDDGNGNTLTQDQNIIIEDTTAPVQDQAILPEIIEQCVVSTLNPPTATDNCLGAITGTTTTTTPITTSTTIIWTYDDGNGNQSTQNQTITITPTTTDAPANITECDSYTLPALTNGNYFTSTNGGGTQLNVGDSITATQTIFVYSESGTMPNCTDENSFTVTINDSPVADAPANVTECDSYTLPALTTGNYWTAAGGTGTQRNAGDPITATQTLFVYAESGTSPNCTDENSFTVTINTSPTADAPMDVTECDSYILPVFTAGNYFTATGGTGTQLNAGNTITSTQTIFVYAESGTTPNCTDENNFIVTINSSPTADAPMDVTECNSYILPALSVGNYFTETGGTGTQLNAGNSITSTQTLFVYAETGTTPNCTDENSFTITINTSPTADAPMDVTECDSYILPVLTAGNYFTATGGTGTQLNAGNTITSTQTLFIYAETGTTPNCTDENSFTVTINDSPITDAPMDVTECDSYILPVLTAGNYFTETGGTGTRLNAGDPITNTQTIFVYEDSGTNATNSLGPSLFNLQGRSNGVFFDIQAVNDISVQSFNINVFNGTSSSFRVYSKSGSFVGSETSPASWNLIATSSIITSTGNFNAEPLDLNLDLNLLAGTTTGFYIYAVAANQSILYSPASSNQDLTANNADVELRSGTGTQNEFNAIDTTQSRGFSGNVIYENGFICSNENSFTITINDSPTVDAPLDVTACDIYELPALISGNYFTATGGAGTQLNAGDPITSTQTIFVFAESVTTPNCTDENSFTVTINDSPVVDDIADVVNQCNDYTLPAITGSNLSGAESYFDGPNGTGTAFAAGSVISYDATATYPLTFFIYDATSTTPICSSQESFELTLISCNLSVNATASQSIFCSDALATATLTANPTPATAIGTYSYSWNELGSTTVLGTMSTLDVNPTTTTTYEVTVVDSGLPSGSDTATATTTITINATPTADAPMDVTECDSYILPALSDGNYFTATGGAGTQLNAGDPITSTQTIFVFAESVTTPNCTDENSFTVTINDSPVVDDIADVVNQCNDYTLPAITGSNLSGAESYFDGPNGTGTAFAAGSVISYDATATYPLTFFIYDATSTTPICSSQESFELTLISCNLSVNATASQSIFCSDALATATLTANPTPATAIGTYSYSWNELGSTTVLGTMSTLDVNPTTTTTYEVTVVDSGLPSGSDTATATTTITINATPTADAPMDVTECDSYVLPALSDGNYFTATGGAGTQLNAGQVISSTQILFVYAESGTTPNCTDENSFTVTINDSPVVDDIADVVNQCNDYTLPAITGSNLSGAESYFDGPNGTGTAFAAGSVISYDATATYPLTFFIYDATSTTPICSSQESFELTLISCNLSVNATASQSIFCSDALATATLTANPTPATAIGTYSYSWNELGSTTVLGTMSTLDVNPTTTTTYEVTVVDSGLPSGSDTATATTTITINATPTADAPMDVTECDSYILPALNDGNYFTATGGAGTQLNAGDPITSTQTIFVFAESVTTPNCTDENSFTVTINDSPVVDDIADVVNQCNDYTLPAITGSNLSGAESYFDGPNGTGTAFAAGSIISYDATATYPLTFFIYDATSTTPICSSQESFELTLISCNLSVNATASQSIFCSDALATATLTANPTPATAIGTYSYSWNELGSTTVLGTMSTLDVNPTTTTTYEVTVVDSGLPSGSDTATATTTITINATPTADAPMDVTECDSYVLPALSDGNYFTATGGAGTQLNAGQVISSTQILFVYAESGTTPNCTDENSFTVTINDSPVVDDIADVVNQCNDYTLPAITGSNLSGAESYFDGPNGTGTAFAAGSVISYDATATYPLTFFIYDATSTTPICSSQESFELTLISCNLSVNATASQSIFCSDALATATLTANPTPATAIGTYSYSWNELGSTTVLGTMSTLDVNPTTTTTYEVTVVDSGLPSGSDTATATTTITINATPTADAPMDVTECDSYILPALSDGNYFTATGGAGTQLNAGDPITSTQTIFVFAESVTTPNCTDENSFTVTINDSPVVDDIADVVNQCNDYTLPAITGSNLSGAESYFDGPNGTGTAFAAGSVISYDATATYPLTFFIYDATSTTPICSSQESFELTLISCNLSVNATASQSIFCSDALATATLTANPTPATAIGTYSYSWNELGSTTVLGTMSTLDVNPTTTTTYEVTVVDSGLPSGSDTATATTTITINATPTADAPMDVTECDSYVLPALSDGNYFTATGGAGTQLNAGQVISSTQILFVYAESGTTPNCTDENSFTVTINDSPVVDDIADVVNQCNDYTLPAITGSNLSGAESYFDGPNGTGTAFAAGSVISYDATATYPLTFFIYDATSTTPICSSQESFELTLISCNLSVNATASQSIFCSDALATATLTANPTPATAIGTYSYSWNELGSTTVLGTMSTLDVNPTTTTTYEVTVVDSGLPSGSDTATATTTITINATPTADAPMDVTECDSYILPALNDGNYFTATGGAGTQLNAGQVISSTQILFVYAESGTTPNCTDENTFTVTISPTPIADSPMDVTVCDSYILPALNVGNYFTVTGGAGTQLNQGDPITSTQTIFVFAESGTTPNCFDENSFTVTINDSPVIDAPTDMTECDSYTLPALTSGNYFTATGGTGTQLNAGDMITNTQTIFVYAETATNPNCSDENSFTVTINDTPTADAPADVAVCDSYRLPALTNGNYFTQSGGMGTPLNAGDSLTATQTLFVYAETGTVPNCSDENSFIITINRSLPVDNLNDVTACDSYTLPILNNGNYFTGNLGTGMSLNAGDVLTTTQTINIYSQSGTTPNCETQTSFTVTINDTPTADAPADVAECDSYTLPALTSGNYFTATGGTGTQLNAGDAVSSTQTIFVYAETATNPNCTDENSFTVTINRTPVTDAPMDVTLCDSYILPALSVGNYFTVTGGTGTQLNAGQVISSTQTIFVYAESATTPDCTDENSFTITINPTPIADAPVDVMQCDSYILPALTAGNYFTGTNGSGTALSPGDTITTTQTLYVYIETGTSPNCTNENSFTVTINSTPIADAPMDITECDSYMLPALTVGDYFTGTNGTGTQLNAGQVISSTQTIFVYAESATTPNCTDENSFIVTINLTPIADAPMDITECDNYILPALTVGNYFTGTNGSGTALSAGDTITSTQTLFVYVETGTTPNCTDENSFIVTINTTPIADTPADVTVCDSYTLPTLAVGNYFTATGGSGSALNPGDTITTSQTIYVFAETATLPNCTDESSFNITINITPTADAPVDVAACDSYTLPTLTTGNYFTGTNGSGTALNAGDVITSTQTLFVYVETGTTPNCTNENSFLVTINTTPTLDLVSDVVICDSYILPAISGSNLTGNQLYYTMSGGNGLAFAEADTLQFNDFASYPVTIYVYDATATSPNCTDEKSFELIINENPPAVAIGNQDFCDDDRDGNENINLSSYSSQISNNEPMVIVTFHSSLVAAEAGSPAIGNSINVALGTETIFARSENTTTGCYDTTSFTVTLNAVPTPVLDNEYTICLDRELNVTGAPFLDTGLTASGYTFEWLVDNGNGDMQVVGANGPTLTPQQPGTYSVVVTDISTGCSEIAITDVIESLDPVNFGARNSGSEQLNDHSISVFILGNYDDTFYEVQLDNGAWIELIRSRDRFTYTFNEVLTGDGLHTVNFRSTNGCWEDSIVVRTIGVPQFFTPNGDGVHDTWNIPSMLSLDPNARISIYDRYGKLIKQIVVSGNGWDGVYNGNFVNENDYWYQMIYLDMDQNGNRFENELKGHFSLKR